MDDFATFSPTPAPSDRSPVFLVVAVIALIFVGIVIFQFISKKNAERSSNLPMIDASEPVATPTEVPNTYSIP